MLILFINFFLSQFSISTKELQKITLRFAKDSGFKKDHVLYEILFVALTGFGFFGAESGKNFLFNSTQGNHY